jgi:hypothetical protein
MRITTLAITGMLAVCVAFPATAAKKRTTSAKMVQSFEACEEKANAQGLIHGQGGHTEFVNECMGGKPRTSPGAAAR